MTGDTLAQREKAFELTPRPMPEGWGCTNGGGHQGHVRMRKWGLGPPSLDRNGGDGERQREHERGKQANFGRVLRRKKKVDRVYAIPRMYTSGLQAISNRRELSVRRSEKGGVDVRRNALVGKRRCSKFSGLTVVGLGQAPGVFELDPGGGEGREEG